jgi:hypothetical protein
VLADWLASLFKRQLGLGAKSNADVERVLEKPDFDSIVKFISSGSCKNIITMAGAGISTCKFFMHRCLLLVLYVLLTMLCYLLIFIMHVKAQVLGFLFGCVVFDDIHVIRFTLTVFLYILQI